MIKTQSELLDDINTVLAGTPKIRASLHRQLEIDIVDTLFSGRPKVYRALSTQSGTIAPTLTVLENTVGAIAWAYTSTGSFAGTLTGAFPAGKVASPQDQSGAFNINTDTPFYMYVERVSDDVIRIRTRDDSFAPANNLLSSKLIEIYVYP